MKGKSVGTWLSEKQLRYQPTEDDFLRGKEEHVLYWSVRPKSVSLFLNIIPEQQPQNHALRECDAYRDTTVARIQNRPLRKQLRTALYHYGPKRGRTSSFDSLVQHHQLSVLLLDTWTRCGVRPTWHNFSLDFCCFCNYNRSHRISVEHINNLSGKAKDGTAAETFLYPSFKYGSFRPSYRWYWCPFIGYIALLLPYRIVAVQLFCLMDLVPSMLMFGLSFCSLIHLTMIAWERYIAIRKWSDYKSKVTKTRLKKMAILAWLTLFVCEFCLFVVMPIAVAKDKTAQALAATILVTGSVSVLACFLVLIVAFYIMIYLGVRKRKLNQILQVNVLIQAKLENRIAMTTALVTIALILSFVPHLIVGTLGRVYPVLRTRFAWRISDSFLYLNSLVNPLIYC